MVRKLTLLIESGDKTCASEPGKHCPWTRTKSFGTVWLCGLFGARLAMSAQGWLLRLDECVAAEQRE